ncbi:MAG TPA: calcium-binding protein [Aromatoleum sp.]|uniref:calcium-binding protein n=1 Tax=Aromatoleum sp. TaxID=2307007 RepID=UPI002B48F769|nr:calcium-binding protein [Aromatoleum sp.]HJV25539.1 calcium-binding protein [Aromatoleum sp.]
MTTFTNLNTTAATLDPGFSYAAYTAQIDAAETSLSHAADTLMFVPPISETGDSTSMHALWGDGTTLDAGVSSVGSTSATLNEIELTAPDGAALDAKGSLKISLTSAGDVQLSNISLREVGIDNDQAAQILFGSGKIDINTGALSGKLSSLVLGWHNDNPATPGDEWLYVKLNGRIAVTGNLDNELGALSGKVTSFEWGTLTASDSGIQSYSPVRAVSGVKIDASHLIDNLETSGFDSLMAGLYATSDKIDGTAGDDYLDASTGNDKVWGEEGNDTLIGGLGNDQLFGGAGDDEISGGAGNDKIVDDGGNNRIDDTEGNANIVTGAGDDRITTGAGNDKIVAGDGNNDINAGEGNNKVTTSTGNDDITTGAGNDKIVAGEGNNEVVAGVGNDNILTGGGIDSIWAGGGNDKIVAGAGDDWIVGGDGADKITGGLGHDTFVFDNVGVGGIDNVADFNAADDILAFDTDVYTSLAGGITADNLVLGKVALDANDFLILDGSKLFYDADGNGAGAAVQIANLKGVLTGISATNFADMDSLLI